MKQIRSFVAVHLNDATRAAIGEAQGRLKASGAKVSWVRPEAMHLTLKFLGDIDAEKVSDFAGALDEAAQNTEPFRFAVRGLGALPRLERPRVIYAGVIDEGGVLAPLAGAVDEWMAELGVGREDRDFKAHITLGRVKSPKGTGTLIDMVRAGAEDDYGSVEVDRVYLMMSELRPAGAEYTVLHEARLQAKQGE
ncbi:MAG: RNA 2',3'-cyclic phosphodiesterase [Planctomycetota bacterium]